MVAEGAPKWCLEILSIYRLGWKKNLQCVEQTCASVRYRACLSCTSVSLCGLLFWGKLCGGFWFDYLLRTDITMTYIYITTFGNGANGINGSTGTNSTFTVLAAIENDHGHDHLTLIKFARLARLRSLVLSGAGRVLMWHEVKGTWNVNKACSMYSGPLKRSLVKIYGSKKRKYTVMEDNDPSGYKSRKAIDCKAANRLNVLPLPRR